MTDVGLEEQFLLRVPPEVAKQIHHMMKDNDLDEVEFSFTDSRHGKFVVEGQEYKLTLVDLPCVVETHKTLDMRSYYKSGDIGQMLLVEEKKDNEEKKEGEEAALPPKLYDHNYRLVDMGVTPATKNIRQRKFRKRPEVPREEVLAAEEELLRRMRGDAYAASENIEIVHESELLKEMGLPAQPEGEKKTPKKRKRKTEGEEGADGENGEKPKKKRRKKGEAAADGAQPADGAAATGDGTATAAGEEGKKPKKPRKKKEEKEGEPKEKKERKKKAPKAQATAPETAPTAVTNNNNTATSAPEPMKIVQEAKPVNPRVAELQEQLARIQSDIAALQKQVDGDIAAVPLELNEVMRGRLEAKIARQQATINSKSALMTALQQELSTLV